jgi:hypothetical protein
MLRTSRGVKKADKAVPPMPGAKDTGRKASPGRFEPRIDERDANSKRGAGHPKEETEDQQQRVRLQRSRKGNQRHWNSRSHREHGEHHSAAITVGERSDGHPAEGADKDRHGDQERGLGGTQTEFGAVSDAQRRDDVPRPESDREAKERQDEVLALTRLQGRGTGGRAGHEIVLSFSGVWAAIAGADWGPAAVCRRGSRSRQIITASIDDVGRNK